MKALNTALEAPVPEPIAGNRRLLGDVKVETKTRIRPQRDNDEDVENRTRRKWNETGEEWERVDDDEQREGG